MADRDENGRWLVGHGQPGPGRDSTYEDWMPEQAHRLALLGLTDEEIARAFGVHPDTLYKWVKKHGAFAEAISSGKERADAEVAYSLYQRARGVTVRSEKAFKGKDGEVVVAQTKTQLAPDVRAAEIWLRNRQRRRWAQVEADSGEDSQGAGDLPAHLTDAEIEERLREYERRRKQEGGE